MDLNQLTSAIPDKALPVASAFLVLVLSIFLGRFIGGLLARVVQRFASPGWELMARRFGLWGIIGLGIAEALQIIGIDLSVLLGAAGFATVAIGFAAQTSTSNLISGLFLMLENAIKVGDFIEVGTLSGEVLSIDPLSVRMRTFDNRMVRVPNELLVKSPLTNLTGFPIRRIDLVLLIPQEADLRAARAALIGLGEADPDVLQQPRRSFKSRDLRGATPGFSSACGRSRTGGWRCAHRSPWACPQPCRRWAWRSVSPGSWSTPWPRLWHRLTFSDTTQQTAAKARCSVGGRR